MEPETAEPKIKSLVMVNYPKTVAKYLNRLIRIGRTKSIHITLSKNIYPNVTVTLKPLPQRYFVRLFQRDAKLIRKYLCDPFKNKKQMGSPKQLFYHAVLNYPEKIKISHLNRIILLKLYYNKKTHQTFYF
jgi:hypothetical protein